MFFSPFSTSITLLGEERANLNAFVCFVLVWICRFPLPLDVWELRAAVFDCVTPGLFSYLVLNVTNLSRRS